jgi:hypothetical protein
LLAFSVMAISKNKNTVQTVYIVLRKYKQIVARPHPKDTAGPPNFRLTPRAPTSPAQAATPAPLRGGAIPRANASDSPALPVKWRLVHLHRIPV